jgi:putative DNA primase/helicase
MMPGLPKADLHLEDRLLAEELPGILRWCVEGARQWFERGLDIPQPVKDASLEYRKEQDAISDFMLTQVIPAPKECVGVTEAYRQYDDYQARRGQMALTQAEFGAAMRAH